MDPRITTHSNDETQLSLSLSTSTSSAETEFFEKLMKLVNERIKQSTWRVFFKENRRDLSCLAINHPSSWLLFSHNLLKQCNTTAKNSKFVRLIKNLNKTVNTYNLLKSSQGTQTTFIDGTFSQIFPKELRKHIAFAIPLSDENVVATLEKMRLILLEDKPLGPFYNEIKNIPTADLAIWIDTHKVPLHLLDITSTELNRLLPRLKYVNLLHYPIDKILNLLKRLKEVKHLICDKMTNDGLINLGVLPKLTHLDLSNCSKITSEGLKPIKDRNQLVRLNLSNCTSITNDDLKEIGELISLKWLNLSACNITDEGIEHLKPLRQLKILFTNV